MSTTGAQATCVVAGSFLSGAMMSLSLMAVPVLLDTTKTAPHLFEQWVRMYHYGHLVLPTMAVGTGILYGYVGARRRAAGRRWALFVLAGLTTMSIIPFTLIFMVPTNNELFRLERVSKTEPAVMAIPEALALVVHWSRLHLTRSFLPLVGATMGAIGTFLS